MSIKIWKNNNFGKLKFNIRLETYVDAFMM